MPSPEHNAIQQWFIEKIPQNVKKEVNIEALSNRRLDIVLESPDIAIEIQCSSMGQREYNARNLDMILSGYYPVWVFGKTFYQKARNWKRYGSMISQIEEREHSKNKCVFYHNKYDLFSSRFSFKGYCEYKGWHKISKLTILDFFKEIQRIYELKLC